MTKKDLRLLSSLARLNALGIGLCTSALAAFGVWSATVLLILRGGPSPGHHLSLLGQYLPGYQISFSGALVGAAWSFVLTFLFSVPSAWLYYLGALKQAEGLSPGTDVTEGGLNQRVSRIHTTMFSLAAGVASGIVLLLMTWLLLIKHQAGTPLGPHLVLLREYLPGFSISFGGGLVGFVYFLILGTLAGAFVGWFYNILVLKWEPSGART